MSDLIDRQAAINAIRKGYPDVINSDYKDGLRIGTDRAIYHVEQLPAAQPEIIRCKDCEWGDIYVSDGNRYCYCMMSDPQIRTANDFCSYAERCKQ